MATAAGSGQCPEYDGSGLLNCLQALAEEIGVPMPELDVVRGCGSGFEAECLANHESYSFCLGFANLFRRHGATVAPMQHLMRLCCRQHNTSYVAQRFMWRPPRDAHKDGSITADQRHIMVE